MTWPRWLERLAAVELTLVCLGALMVLVFCGTIAQVHLGTFAAQKLYFNSWWVMRDVGDFRIPVLPGGLLIGGVWLINLIANFIVRFRPVAKDAGIFLSHLGLIFLLSGQFFTQALSRETQMPIPVGQSLNYTEALRDTELVLIKDAGDELDEVTSIPYSHFSREGTIALPRLPFRLVVHRFMKNADLVMAVPGSQGLATQGIGLRVDAREVLPVSSDEEVNATTAFIEVRDPADRSLGVWLISSGLGAPQSFNIGGVDYRMLIRPRRYYLPYTLTLKQFRHDVYPGTDIPKNFSSLVHLSRPERHESRDALIYMNHPLRYEGQTFYQASFGEGDKLSVLQVVSNPASPIPYLACAMVALGLAIQFLAHLLGFARGRS